MARKLFLVLVLLTVFALVFSACATTEEPAPAEAESEEVMEEEPVEEEPAEEPAPSGSDIMGRVLERGKVICGARTDLAGFGMLDDAGNNIGFDIDICRAVAAAVFGDPNAVEVVPLTAADRGPALQTGEVDILSRNVSADESRDGQWGNFTYLMFYDGQGFMIREDSGTR